MLVAPWMPPSPLSSLDALVEVGSRAPRSFTIEDSGDLTELAKPVLRTRNLDLGSASAADSSESREPFLYLIKAAVRSLAAPLAELNYFPLF